MGVLFFGSDIIKVDGLLDKVNYYFCFIYEVVFILIDLLWKFERWGRDGNILFGLVDFNSYFLVLLNRLLMIDWN